MNFRAGAAYLVKSIGSVLICSFLSSGIRAQNYDFRSLVYTTIGSSILAGTSAVINKKPGEKIFPSFLRGFTGGAVGGAVMYAGKKSNYLIVRKRNISMAWLSRAIFSAGNSLTENAAAGLPFFSRWHYDLGFVRLEYRIKDKQLRPLLMPSMLGGFLMAFSHGSFDAKTSLQSGVPVFRTNRISYAPYLVGSTTGNDFLLSDTLGTGKYYHEIFAHEMVHTFQFAEWSAFNYMFAKPMSTWRSKSRPYARISEWIYGDLNYEIFLFNYFVLNGGLRRSLYCKNYLENEAEWLSTRRVSCPACSCQ